MPMSADARVDAKMKNILFERGLAGGRYLGYDEYRKVNNESNYFGKDEDVPGTRSLLVTDEVMDSWLASHYDITLD